MAPTVTYLPTMLMTLVRRVSSKLPYNHFLFRVAPQYTKAEIKEYLEKVYNVQVSRITTSISLGKTRRAMGKRSLFHKLKDYKRALVQLRDDRTVLKAPAAEAAPSSSAAKQQLR